LGHSLSLAFVLVSGENSDINIAAIQVSFAFLNASYDAAQENHRPSLLDAAGS
jgi:hypothetical protein